MNLPDPRDQMRNKQELLQERALQNNIINMTIQQLLQMVKDTKERRKREQAMRALLMKILGFFKSLNKLSKSQAADISKAGNGGDSVKSGSAGDAAKAGTK